MRYFMQTFFRLIGIARLNSICRTFRVISQANGTCVCSRVKLLFTTSIKFKYHGFCFCNIDGSQREGKSSYFSSARYKEMHYIFSLQVMSLVANSFRLWHRIHIVGSTRSRTILWANASGLWV